MKRLLFLCTGNYYRSRFAEIFFNWHAKQVPLNWRADSRGLALDARNLGPMSSHTVARLTLLQIPSKHCQRFPAPLTQSDLEEAEMVIAVKANEHRPLMRNLFPSWLDRVEFWHIHDLDCATSDESLPTLEKEVLKLIERLATMENPAAA